MNLSDHYEQNNTPYSQRHKILDPRAFLKGNSMMWINTREHANAPVLSGNIAVPKRLLDWVFDNSEALYIKGERCIKVAVDLWEVDPTKFYSSDFPPVYRGLVTPYRKALDPYIQQELVKAYRVMKGKDNDLYY